MTSHRKSVYAAGGVVWRPVVDGEPAIEVAVIHRPRYDDWTLPKGKCENDETFVATAVREIAEETGYSVRLGRHLRRVDYDLGSSSRKYVHYWSARVTGGEFVLNEEVDEIEWCTLAAARDRLSYGADRKVLAEFARLPADLHTVLVVRHAKAGRSARYRGDDRLRPLEPFGWTQAERLVEQFTAFGGRYLHAADRTRCLQTLEPLAVALSAPIRVEPALSEESYKEDPESALTRVREIARADGVHVICSQGKVIPGLLASWVGAGPASMPRTRNRKAGMWVLTLDGDDVVSVDHIDSPLRRADSD
ncbi:NUDIX hydrolase [Williamsia maris]|uniref:8-oxo-dGTP diphosphatase n=1 Tax=Williamsia maris TaxID=72806 RepID=A0ABT1HG09_9NOCA|nr:NUDIX hydrolase [Williamsia maris]MCP2177179.1 8-oxo-dGTP diphosphatase [Williamsia maris]